MYLKAARRMLVKSTPDQGIDFQMLFTDVDILFTRQALTTIRLMTLENHSVYFPIVYSLFRDDDNNNNNNNDNNNYFDDRKSGYWRYFGYG
jgi:hypothetical protein